MLHRTTWVAIPVLALVLVGSGVGWWGYNQYQQRQALATQTENQYSASFHGLVEHMTDLQEELGKARVSGDPVAFQGRLRDIWRLSYAAQTEVGRLPFDLMPMHQTQQFLSTLSNTSEKWMANSALPKVKSVQTTLQSYYTESKKYSSELEDLQGTLFDNRLKWSAVSKTLQTGKGDNQIVDGFRNIDTQASAYVESKDRPTTLVRDRTFNTQHQPDVTEGQARTAVARFLQIPVQSNWKVTMTAKGAYRPAYIVEGQSANGPFRATVSKDGGHVLSLEVSAQSKGHSVEFADAEQIAAQWLKQRGFGSLDLVSSNQYADTGFYVFSPLRTGVVVLGQSIAVHVNLGNAQVIAYDGSNFYDYPVHNLPARKYTSDQLQKYLNASFHVEMKKDVDILDDTKHYVPAVAFYGTSDGETYCIYINAVNGREVTMDQLS